MTRSFSSCVGALLIAAMTACSNGPPPRSSSFSAPKKVVTSTPAPAKAPSAKNVADADRRFSAALKLMKDKQPTEAQAAFQSLATDFPEYSGPLTALGILYAQGKQRDQALASFAKAAAANPNNAVAWNWLGSLYRENNNFKQAEDAYRKALAARSDYAAAHLNLGILYDVAMRRPQDAVKEYREYQRIAGNDNLMVGVWIKELETSSTQRTASAGDAQ
ncbi:MAG: tetratricopeptide repeat protein [Hydrocarboniphaga sp.]|uniref:tetratricopeptide repeat protein n=1 Tax=Hydrocarboniphaga sp. TaxID=2033016 RepID=UPI0026172496|nr:tetratricopeptide repeat protein [Hydrocarboniphaga sp.]MDB5970649.1 tetratricopeptide repeat protein [Hydrocarboniphaga sp.]